MTTTDAPEASDVFIIAPAGGEFAVTNRVTGEFLGYFQTRSAADTAAVQAMRAITDLYGYGAADDHGQYEQYDSDPDVIWGA